MRTGRMLKEDGTTINVADILGGTPTGEVADIEEYAPMSGRMVKEDGTVVNIAESFEEMAGGGDSKPLKITVGETIYEYDGKEEVNITLTPAEGVNF